MPVKKCVVSFADHAGDYAKKLQRLKASLKGNFDGDFIAFTSHEEIGCQPHSVIPYQFKPYAIAKTIEMGYDLILWCDSPIVAVKNIQPVFDHIEKHGYLFFDNIGHPVGRWTNDKTLAAFGVTRDEAMDIKMIMACCMGFDFRQKLVRHVLQHYYDVSKYLFPGSWSDHRHDQSVMSLLIHDFDLEITTGHETFFAYEAHKAVLPVKDSVCLFSK